MSRSAAFVAYALRFLSPVVFNDQRADSCLPDKHVCRPTMSCMQVRIQVALKQLL